MAMTFITILINDFCKFPMKKNLITHIYAKELRTFYIREQTKWLTDAFITIGKQIGSWDIK